MVGETGIRVVAAFVLLCGFSVTAAFTISQYNRRDIGFGVSRMTELAPQSVKPITSPIIARDERGGALDGADYETIDYNIQYPQFLAAREHDTPESTTWKKIWLANPSLGAPDGLGTYNEDYSKVSVSSVEDGIQAAL